MFVCLFLKVFSEGEGGWERDLFSFFVLFLFPCVCLFGYLFESIFRRMGEGDGGIEGGKEIRE